MLLLRVAILHTNAVCESINYKTFTNILTEEKITLTGTFLLLISYYYYCNIFLYTWIISLSHLLRQTSFPIWYYFFSKSSKSKIFPLKSNRTIVLIYIWQELTTMKIFVFIYLSILQVFRPFGVNSCSGGKGIKIGSECVTRKIFFMFYIKRIFWSQKFVVR